MSNALEVLDRLTDRKAELLADALGKINLAKINLANKNLARVLSKKGLAQGLALELARDLRLAFDDLVDAEEALSELGELLSPTP